jgi:xanthine dehydrogenase iron-sulfur cluster and FAD-binding subunit A
MLPMVLTILNLPRCTGCRAISQAAYIIASNYGLGRCVR